jgi:FixJ family two-component response regulator
MTISPPAEAAAPMGAATVYVVEDDEQVRHALGGLLEGVGLHVETFAEAASFLQLKRLNRPGCVVLDLRMPRISGIEVLETLRMRGFRIPVIMVTGFGDVNSAVRAMKAGAADFVEKPVQPERLIAQVQACLKVDQLDSRTDFGRDAVRQRFDSLTVRERQVMERVVAGTSNKLIARELGVSPRTVEHHRARVMEKTGSRSLAELIQLAALI